MKRNYTGQALNRELS